MNAREIRAAIDTGAVVLDVRPPRDFAAGHLPGAINLQFNRADLATRATMALPKTLELIVHAEPEPAARVAALILDEAGFTVPGHLEGGLKARRARGLPPPTIPPLHLNPLHHPLPPP